MRALVPPAPPARRASPRGPGCAAAALLALALLGPAAPAGAQECFSCWSATCPELAPYLRACSIFDRRAPRSPPRREGPEPAPPRGTCPGGMAFLPRGTYRMGVDGTTVTVRAFCLDLTEVTVGAYARCVRAGDCQPAAATVDRPGIREDERTAWSPYCNRDRDDRGDHPVNCVTWEQAARYCRSAGKRLPTEEEWEWAARGADRATPYPWGEDDPSGRVCWNGANTDLGKGKRQSTCPVGSYPGGDSPHGIKDLSGNVWEWTASAEPCGEAGGCRVARGGGWYFDVPAFFSAAYRYWAPPSLRGSFLGFRCARTVGGPRD